MDRHQPPVMGKERPWTPGPWARRVADGSYCAPDLAPLVIQGDGWEIALVIGDVVAVRERTEANARLIAAAPALYEALEGLTRLVGAFSHTTQRGKSQKARLEAARAALRHARGEP